MRSVFLALFSASCLLVFVFLSQPGNGNGDRRPAAYPPEYMAYDSASETTSSNAPEESLRPEARPDFSYNESSACTLQPCTRSEILNRRPKGKNCLEHVLDTACKHSPWRDKSAKERYESVIKTVRKYNHLHGWKIDARAMLCIFAKEGWGLEPIMLNSGSCKQPGRATDTGLGQVLNTTAGDLICRLGFKSKHPQFREFSCVPSEAAFSKNPKSVAYDTGRPSVDRLIGYPEAQIEAAMATFRKKGGEGTSLKKSHFRDYNGGKARNAYANSVYSCYRKMKSQPVAKGYRTLNSYRNIANQRKDIAERCSKNLKKSIKPKLRPDNFVAPKFNKGGR